MDVLGSVGCLGQPLGKLRVLPPLAQSPGAVCSIQPGEAIGPESQPGLARQTGPTLSVNAQSVCSWVSWPWVSAPLCGLRTLRLSDL